MVTLPELVHFFYLLCAVGLPHHDGEYRTPRWEEKQKWELSDTAGAQTAVVNHSGEQFDSKR